MFSIRAIQIIAHPDLNRGHNTPTSTLVKFGDTYELKDGGFLKVKELKHHTKSLVAVGRMFRRVSETEGLVLAKAIIQKR